MQAARTGPTVILPLEEHVGTVYRYALRLAGRSDIAEDITQETLLRAWRGRARMHEPRSSRLWLLRIASNLWTDHLRRKKFRPRALEAEPPCTRPQPSRITDQQEDVRRSLAAMDELPPRQRQVMYLATCEGLSHAEVAEVLEIEVSAVKSSLSLARGELRRRLKDVYQEVCGRRACEDK
jgi:RNA polymerase sigma-70 factor (ECF subfamily)